MNEAIRILSNFFFAPHPRLANRWQINVLYAHQCVKIGVFLCEVFSFSHQTYILLQIMEGGKTKVREGVDFYQYLLSIGDEVYDIIIKIIMMI